MPSKMFYYCQNARNFMREPETHANLFTLYLTEVEEKKKLTEGARKNTDVIIEEEKDNTLLGGEVPITA